MNIGVLALQGDFEAHQLALADLGVASVQVRTAAELAGTEGLIMPGGESTTMLKLLLEEGLFEPLRSFGASKPIFGTCAGVILLAKEVRSPAQQSLGLLDVVVERNAYGRQLDSSIRRLEPEAPLAERTESGPVEAVFIRAPIIRSTGEAVKTLLRDGETPVLVEQGRLLAATFHPELTSDRRIHRLWLNKIRDE